MPELKSKRTFPATYVDVKEHILFTLNLNTHKNGCGVKF